MEKSFNQKVYDVVSRIPKGKVASYGQIAAILGNPRGARQVGWAMSNCPEGYPWHRVVMADGSIASGGHGEMRRDLLLEEDVIFSGDEKVDMKKCRWEDTKVELG